MLCVGCRHLSLSFRIQLYHCETIRQQTALIHRFTSCLLHLTAAAAAASSRLQLNPGCYTKTENKPRQSAEKHRTSTNHTHGLSEGKNKNEKTEAKIQQCSPYRTLPLGHLNAASFNEVHLLCGSLISAWVVSQVACCSFAPTGSGDRFFFLNHHLFFIAY